eukprot:m.78507 g.78507  ORF g.78507 m.78507 type:complete len:996 (-) comp14505_c0_seq2:2017-5004(-)
MSQVGGVTSMKPCYRAELLMLCCVALGESIWLPAMRGVEQGHPLHYYQPQRSELTVAGHQSKLQSTNAYRNSTLQLFVLSSRAEQMLAFSFRKYMSTDIGLGAESRCGPSCSYRIFKWLTDDNTGRIQRDFWTGGPADDGGRALNGWYAIFFEDPRGVRNTDDEPNNPSSEPCAVQRNWPNDNDEGFAATDMNCNARSTVYEHISPCPAPRHVFNGSHCVDLNLCQAFPDICAPYPSSSCVTDSFLGYKCVCPAGWYRNASQDECQQCKDPCPSDHFEAQQCTEATDRVCISCEPCKDGISFQTQPCTATSDRVCNPCSECTTGLTSVGACTVLNDTVCQDISPPVLTLLGPSLVFLEFGANYSEPGYVATDRGGSLNHAVQVLLPQLNNAPLGEYTINYSVSDGVNLTTNVTRAVIIEDTTPPILTITPPLQPYTRLERGTRLTFQLAASDRHDGNLTSAIVTTQQVLNSTAQRVRASSVLVQQQGYTRLGDGQRARDFEAWSQEVSGDAPPGTSWIVNYTVQDQAGNRAQSREIVEVVDTKAPTLLLPRVAIDLPSADDMCNPTPTPSEIERSCFRRASSPFKIVSSYTQLQNLTLLDPDGIVQDDGLVLLRMTHNARVIEDVNASYPVGSVFEVDYIVSDWWGNTQQYAQPWTVVDTLFPVVVLRGNASVIVSVNQSYTDAGAIAYDLRDGYLTNLKMESTVQLAVEGTYQVTYTAVDQAGLNASTTRKVTVIPLSSVKSSASFIERMGWEVIAIAAAGLLLLLVLIIFLARRRRRRRKQDQVTLSAASLATSAPSGASTRRTSIAPSLDGLGTYDVASLTPAASSRSSTLGRSRTSTVVSQVPQHLSYDVLQLDDRALYDSVVPETAWAEPVDNEPQSCLQLDQPLQIHRASRAQAVQMLAGCKLGTYVARIAGSRTGGVAVSIQQDTGIQHHIIDVGNGVFRFDSKPIESKERLLTIEEAVQYVVAHDSEFLTPPNRLAYMVPCLDVTEL